MRLASLLTLLVVGLVRSALAQIPTGTGAPDVGLVLPAALAGGPLLGEDFQPLPGGAFSVELMGHYAHRVFSIHKQGEHVRLLQGDVFARRLSVVAGIGAGFEVAVWWDGLMYQSGMRVNRDEPWNAKAASGNVEGALRWVHGWDVGHDVSLGAGVGVHAGGHPWSEHPAYFGSRWLAGGTVMAGLLAGPVGVSFSAGLDARAEEHFLDRRYDRCADLRATAYLARNLPVLPEFSVLARVWQPFDSEERSSSAAAGAGLRWPITESWQVGLAGGSGLGVAPGAPDWYMLLSVLAERVTVQQRDVIVADQGMFSTVR